MPLLGEAVRDGEQGGLVRMTAAEALGNIGPDAKDGVRVLIEVLEDSANTGRAAVAAALGQIGAKDAIPALTELEKSGKPG